MSDKLAAAQPSQSNAQHPPGPGDCTAGDEPMTGAQRSYLKTLSEEAKIDFDDTLTKAEASRRIEELWHVTGRGEAAVAAPMPRTERADEEGGAPVDELDLDGDGARNE
jgi:hypothetical protein